MRDRPAQPVVLAVVHRAWSPRGAIPAAVQRLAQRADEDQKFHTTTALYNLVTSNRKMGAGVNEILTSIFQTAREDTRHICGNALISSHSGGKNSSYSDGSIVAPSRRWSTTPPASATSTRRRRS